MEWHEKYLGLPTLIDRSKKIVFASIKDRMWKKLHDWKEKLISKAGKEVLIKAVARSILTHAMSCFQLPKTFCDELNPIMANFWWGNTGDKCGIHWKTWTALCKSKDHGGLGFCDLNLSNNAMLAKQLWRLHLFPESLLSRTLKARYFLLSDIWSCSMNS